MSKSDFVFNTRPLHDHTIFDLTNGSTEISSSIRVLLEYGDLWLDSSGRREKSTKRRCLAHDDAAA
eukprot:SAG11_NODE_2754_length_3007_cov_10.651307_4_plen_66_part_00